MDVSKKLTNKFKKLNTKNAASQRQSTRPSLIKQPVQQLQKDNPLPPEAVSLLSLGPKFVVTPKEIPKMEIMCEVKKVCLTLERKGKKEEAQEVCHNTAELLKKQVNLNLTLQVNRKKAFPI